MNLYFARHGQSIANVQHIISNRDVPHPLTDLGREQARALAEKLRAVRLNRIYTSPIPRAVETAQIAAAAHGLDYEITGALREFDCGVIENRGDPESWARQKQVWDAWLIHGDYEARVEGGESFRDIQARFVPFIDQLLRQSDGSDANLLLVGHGGLYLTMLPLVLGNIDQDFALARSIDHTHYILAEQRKNRLVCIEWCGEPVGQ
ncbi:MAG: histidine phosphatase family protein [Anaerolineae bacterium]|nr:histidine phosphatase family protein [Anaerolineae bacterium]